MNDPPAKVWSRFVPPATRFRAVAWGWVSLIPIRLQKILWMVRQPRWRRFVATGLGPSLEHRKLLQGRSFSTVVDVGANVGQFAIWADATLDPRTLVCIEPQADLLERLQAVATLTGADTHVVVAALTSAAGDATLHITRANDSSSLLTPVSDVNSGLGVVRTERVPTYSGDEVLSQHRPLTRPALLKIDVQGLEFEVLKGLSSSLEDFDTVLIEVSIVPAYEGQSLFTDVVQTLSTAGFQPVAAARVPGTRRDLLEQIDILFDRTEA